DMLTIGQYLMPSCNHLPVRRYVHPGTFKMYEEVAYKMGFKHAAVGAMVRSSYHADHQAHGVTQQPSAILPISFARMPPHMSAAASANHLHAFYVLMATAGSNPGLVVFDFSCHSTSLLCFQGFFAVNAPVHEEHIAWLLVHTCTYAFHACRKSPLTLTQAIMVG